MPPSVRHSIAREGAAQAALGDDFHTLVLHNADGEGTEWLHPTAAAAAAAPRDGKGVVGRIRH